MKNRTSIQDFLLWRSKIREIRKAARKAKRDTEFHPVAFIGRERRIYFRNMELLLGGLSLGIMLIPIFLITGLNMFGAREPLKFYGQSKEAWTNFFDWLPSVLHGAPWLGAIVLAAISVLAIGPMLDTFFRISLKKWGNFK